MTVTGKVRAPHVRERCKFEAAGYTTEQAVRWLDRCRRLGQDPGKVLRRLKKAGYPRNGPRWSHDAHRWLKTPIRTD